MSVAVGRMDGVILDDPPEVGHLKVGRETGLQVVDEWSDGAVVALFNPIKHVEDKVDAEGVNNIGDRLEIGVVSQGHLKVLEECVQIGQAVLVGVLDLIQQFVDHVMLVPQPAILPEKGRIGRKDESQFSEEQALDDIPSRQCGCRMVGCENQDARVG